MKFLHVMDPIERIDITKDTSFVFIREAQDRGHDNFYCSIADLSFQDGRVMVRAASLRVSPVQGSHADTGEWLWREAEEFHCVFMRKDPPFDTDFFFATHLLSLIDARKTLVFNDAAGLREATEKLFILRFPELIAPTMVAASPDVILAFRDRVGGDIVVKPLDGCGGLGIFRIAPGDLNTYSILETSTHHGTRPVMAQRFLPESRQGDVRLLYLDGKPLGAVRRVPRQDDLRGNIHVGGVVVATEIGEREKNICATLAPQLEALGIWFAGLDVIGDYLTEVNVTSPTGVQEANRLSGVKLEAKVIESVERKCAGLLR
ncbi:MAG: glutathione synthase [Deltaproteobacteria bacterium]|nr:glutathione synthase [Deltaproteobacteria bacterium]